MKKQKSAKVKTFFQAICSIGKLMFLVRNEYAVHEIIENNYAVSRIENELLEIKSKNTNTLLDISKISFVFYESTMSRGKKLYNFQLFDANGDSIIKIYLKNNNISGFKKIQQRTRPKIAFDMNMG